MGKGVVLWGWRGGGERLLPRKEREESIKKCPDWLKKHPDEEKRREGVFLCVLIGFTSSLTAAVLGEAPSPPAPAGAGSARDAICWEISWRYQSERCQGLLWGRSPTMG